MVLGWEASKQLVSIKSSEEEDGAGQEEGDGAVVEVVLVMNRGTFLAKAFVLADNDDDVRANWDDDKGAFVLLVAVVVVAVVVVAKPAASINRIRLFRVVRVVIETRSGETRGGSV